MTDNSTADVIEASLDTTRPVASRQVEVMRGDAKMPVPGGTASPPATAVQTGEVLPPRRRRRRFLLPLIALVALGYGAHRFSGYYAVGRFLVSTDDAYVKADMSIIAAKIPGYLTAVAVAENGHVHAGDLLASIDPGDYQLAVDAANAKIATQNATIDRLAQQGRAQNSVIEQARAQMMATDAQLSGARADLTRATGELERSTKLQQSSFGTAQRLEQAVADRDRAQAAVASGTASGAAARAAVLSAQANQSVMEAQKNEAVKMRGELEAALQKVQRDLAFTQVRAPFDGIVGNRAAQPGQYVQPGTRLLALIPLGSIYVEANFKETQLGNLKPGQKVDITVDSLAGQKIEGVLDSIAPASGSQYSLLPPENATGNFTKIVQRVPVRIRVPAELAASGQLRPGLSVVADVRTRDESLPEPSLLGAIGLPRLTQR